MTGAIATMLIDKLTLTSKTTKPMTTQQRIDAAKEIMSKQHGDDPLIRAIIQLINICHNQQQQLNSLQVVEDARLDELKHKYQ